MTNGYAMMVKGPNGRKWFRADSVTWARAHNADVEGVQKAWADHGLKFMMSNAEEDVNAPIAPKKYRPWAMTDGDD